MPRIMINGITADPDVDRSLLCKHEPDPPIGNPSRYLLIQVDHPLDRAAKSRLEEVNAHVLEYVPEQTYLCRYLPADLRPLLTLPFVRFACRYPREFKISPALMTPDRRSSTTLRELTELAPLTERFDQVSIVLHALHADIETSTARGRLAAALGLELRALSARAGGLVARLSGAQLLALIGDDDVHHVDVVGGNGF
jgi:serine protease AprX